MKKVYLTKNELEIVRNILKKYPSARVFGSRIKGTHRKFSDLDIAISEPLSFTDHELLLEQFEQSDLPFKVDIVEYGRASESFRKIVDTTGVTLTNLEPVEPIE